MNWIQGFGLIAFGVYFVSPQGVAYFERRSAEGSRLAQQWSPVTLRIAGLICLGVGIATVVGAAGG